MDEKLDAAIGNVTSLIRANIKPEDALKYSQSVLNLAHAKSVLALIELDGVRTSLKGSGKTPFTEKA